MSIQVKNAKSITLGGQQVKQIKDTNGNVLWKKVQFWWEDTAYLNSLTVDDVGTENEVEVNGVIHKVRLIGVDHDDLETGGKAHTTWQFVNAISDANGDCIAAFWHETSTTSGGNYDFINSSIRKALTGKGNASVYGWYQKTGTTKSSVYNKSLIEMLPAGLVAKMKEVTKKVATTSSYTLTDFTDKLFLLSYREMTPDSSSYAKEEGATYKYWQNHNTNADRITKQIHGDVVYTTSAKPTDTPYAQAGNTCYNYAGYNYKADATGGAVLWLRSPGTNGGSVAWLVGRGGSLDSSFVYYSAYGVAPAFCL